MVYVCDNCHFLFSHAAVPEQCPDCGKYTVRPANEAERQEYEERLKARSAIKYRELTFDELCPELFTNFIRHQVVTKCWRREDGKWVIRDDPFIDDWSKADYQTLISCLKNTIMTGGFVRAAFVNDRLKGFVSVEPSFLGGEQKYMDLSSIHVSEDLRGVGIGSELFHAAKEWAKEKGAKKLYISAHSAVETQLFYHRLGCVEAQMYNSRHVEAEPFDCQLEYVL